MRLVYFARVREIIGIDGEDHDFPESVHTVSDCLDWLIQQGPAYADTLTDRNHLRFALDQHLVGLDAALAGAEELAIFPPVTGG